MSWTKPIEDCPKCGKRNKAVMELVSENSGDWRTKPCKECSLKIHTKRIIEYRIKEQQKDASFCTKFGIPKRYWEIPIYDKNKFMDKDLLFVGKAGYGKTHMSISIFKKYIFEKGVKKCLFVPCVDLFANIKKEFNSTPDESFIDKCMYSDILIIDDLGKTKGTEWSLETLYQIINHRYNEMLLTMYTTNHTVESLLEAVGRATYERIMDNTEVITMQSKNWRERT